MPPEVQKLTLKIYKMKTLKTLYQSQDPSTRNALIITAIVLFIRFFVLPLIFTIN